MNKLFKEPIYNFGAGPAVLPQEVLLKAQKELLNWNNTGMSVMEVGHRTAPYQQLLFEAEALLRTLLNVPDNYYIFFLNGPARLQFAMIPMNFIGQEKRAAYITTGLWSSLAYEEATRIGSAYTVERHNILFQPDTSYIYYTPNETVSGFYCPYPVYPSCQDDIFCIADMTSCLLMEPIDVSQYGLIFAGAQKNIANAGLTVVIAHDQLLKKSKAQGIPAILNYMTHVQAYPSYATPPTFNCYIALLMFRWLTKQGGIKAMHEQKIKKAQLLYDYIDTSSFYYCKTPKENRSLINICFYLTNEMHNTLFNEGARRHGLYALEGHRTEGGFRASLYNAMPFEGAMALLRYMQAFEKNYG